MGAPGTRVLQDEIRLYTIQVTGKTPYNDDIMGDVDLGLWPAAVSTSPTTESEQGRDAFITMNSFIVGPDCPVDGVDSVDWRGKRYEVVGDPQFHYVRTVLHHKEFQGRLIEGG